jgi:hypothetical protein
MLKQEAYETSIIPIDDSRTNHHKKRGNDIIQERVEQGNSDSSIIVSTVQFYNKNYNSQSNH